mmetsp:Transcript_2266/g.9681  ORF Transcript_2266/g.9681 Transcript_2266/m.9681 type:complete len:210 (+) Transcript_2266:622-1251(+)
MCAMFSNIRAGVGAGRAIRRRREQVVEDLLRQSRLILGFARDGVLGDGHLGRVGRRRRVLRRGDRAALLLLLLLLFLLPALRGGLLPLLLLPPLEVQDHLGLLLGHQRGRRRVRLQLTRPFHRRGDGNRRRVEPRRRGDHAAPDALPGVLERVIERPGDLKVGDVERTRRGLPELVLGLVPVPVPVPVGFHELGERAKRVPRRVGVNRR